MDEQTEHRHDQDITVGQLITEVQTVEEEVPAEQAGSISGMSVSMHFEDECESTPESASQPVPLPQEHKVNLKDICHILSRDRWDFIVSYIYASYGISDGALSLGDRSEYIRVASEAMSADDCGAQVQQQPKRKNKFQALIDSGVATSLSMDSDSGDSGTENAWNKPITEQLENPYVFRLAFISALKTLAENKNAANPFTRNHLVSVIPIESQAANYYRAAHRPYNLYTPSYTYI